MKKCPLIILLLLLTYSFIRAQESNKLITVDDIWGKYIFRTQSVAEINSLNDGEHFCRLEDNNIYKYEFKTGKIAGKLFEGAKYISSFINKDITIEDYELSNDESKILIKTESERIYRHSYKSIYYAFDSKNDKIIPVANGEKIRLAHFSPDGKKISYIKDNNLYLENFDKKETIQITYDGKNNNIINGTTDWVYEEEFSITEGYKWSPDGNKIAYYKFDESKVKEYDMQIFGELYPKEYKFKYPKAGEDNSFVDIFVYNLTSGNNVRIETGAEKDNYIPRIQWTKSPELLSVQRLNRRQNELEILLCNANSGESKVVYKDKNKYYIEISDDLTFTDDNKYFIISNEKDGYNHLYLYDIDGNPVNQITKGEWDMLGFKGYDQKSKTIYYISSEISPIDKMLFSINVNGTGKKQLSEDKGINNASFSKGFKYFVSTYSNANTPPIVTIKSTKGNKQLVILEDNKELAGKIREYNFTPKEFFTYNTSKGIKLYCSMIKPKDFDSTKKYPVLFQIYGGPNSQTVTNGWGNMDFAWQQMLAQKGYIIVSVDNRGTGARGEDFRKCTYMQLGKLETEDMIETSKYLKKLKYIDSSRIGIEGWSFGGYLTSLCLTKGADYFKTGIAVAPVTNWRYYDNIYTERYMRKPSENESGYDENAPTNYVDKLKGKLLIIHGSADDNVHFQNTMEFADKLIKANKKFEMFIYPNKNHGIYGGNTRLNLFTKMTDFIMQNL
ncbi:MAG: S9 family peptidase [Bacteroidota bacterium]|nr:S9 family peptidase [Bacteroidota bacterium]